MFNSKELGALSDRDLLAAAEAYTTALSANAAGLNFTNAEITAIQDIVTAFSTILDAWDALQLEEAGVGETKSALREALLKELRRQRNAAYSDETITDEARAGYGMPPHDKTKTDSPMPSTAPIGWVDYSKLKHTIHFRDSATPDKKAKPAGMLGCEIWAFIGTAPPTSESDFDYVATDTNSPYVLMFEMADAGKRVFYQLRWLSKSGERGEWSETIEATVNG